MSGKLDKAPRLGINIVICILSSDTETSATTPLGGGARKLLAKSSQISPLSCTGCFFNCSALKITKCQPAREISDLFLPKKGLRMKKIKVPELFRTVHLHKTTKEKLQVTQLLLPLAACLKIANLRIESNLLLLSREVVYSADY